MRRSRSLRLWCGAVLASTGMFFSVWIVLPAYHRHLLPLTVGAPEISFWFIVLALLGLVLMAKDFRRSRLAQLGAMLAVVGIGLSSIPYLRFSTVASSADLAMRMALGGDYIARIPDSLRARMAPSPLMPKHLLFGYEAPDTRVDVTSNVVFRTVGGVSLAAHVYHPIDTGLRPVLIQVYGGAWQRGTPDDHAEFATYFAQQGYVVVAVDYRHAPAFTFPAQADDVRYALDWVIANAGQLRVDTSRIALVGRSAGAHLAMLTAYAPDAPHIRAVVNFYGPVDLIEGYESPPHPDPLNVRSIEEAFLGGTPAAQRDRYRMASPITYVTRQLPPTMLLYGGRDRIVLPRFGSLLAGRLRAEGNIVVHVEIPWADHAFDAVPNGPSGQLSRYLIERFLAWAMEHESTVPKPIHTH